MEIAKKNTVKQKRFYDSKVADGESKISCWLPDNDRDRLLRLMDMLGYGGKGKKQQGYSEVFSQALKELEISLTPAPQREIIRYGLRNMENRDN